MLILRSLSYEKSQTLFRVGQPPFSPVTREIPLSNQFGVPVVLYDVKLPSKAQEYFNVSLFTIYGMRCSGLMFSISRIFFVGLSCRFKWLG